MGGWTLGQDLRQAMRVMRAQPGFAAAAIVMLALGIGSTTAIFSVVKAVLINPLPYANADALVRLAHNIGGIDQPYFNDAIYLTYAESSQAFESVGVWSPEGTGVTITGRGDPEEARALSASRGLFTTLGVQPEIGRWFSVEEDVPGSPRTVMLGEGYWRRRFGRDTSVVGQSIVINGQPHQIIGVMPARFTFGGEFDVMLPLRINPARPVPFFYLNGVARMKPGVTLEAAKADISRVLETYFDKYKANTKREVRWVPIPAPLKQVVVGDVGPTLWVLMGTIAIVLLMACANVANLLLIRAESRRQEFAIRAALGARWTRVARSLLVESMVLAVFGGALGLALAYGGLRLLVAVEPANVPRLSEIAIDPAVVLFAIAITLLCGVLFSLIPIARSFGPRLTGAIGVGTRGISLTRERQRSQYALVAAQMALALVLLVSSGLMMRSFQALRDVDPGFAQPQTLQGFTITIPASMEADLEQADAHAAGDSRQGHRPARSDLRGIHDAIADGSRGSLERGDLGGRHSGRGHASEPPGEGRLARDVSHGGHAARERAATSPGRTSTRCARSRSCRRTSRETCGDHRRRRSVSAFASSTAPKTRRGTR